jgi:hypothetical protein
MGLKVEERPFILYHSWDADRGEQADLIERSIDLLLADAIKKDALKGKERLTSLLLDEFHLAEAPRS